MNFEEFKQDFDEKMSRISDVELRAYFKRHGAPPTETPFLPICLAELAAGLRDLSDYEATERTMNQIAPPGFKWNFNPTDPDKITGWWVPKCCGETTEYCY